jgi:hypothetical protein
MHLPHFIIIGAMKSATTSLQEQLVQQLGVFMCEPKEPNFFSDDNQYARGLGWYSGLFADAADGDLLGEASTHYTKLPTYPHAVARLKEHVPGARFVYVMRHPVDRLISHYVHEWSMGVYRCGINEAVERYPEMVAYGQYARQLAPYFETFGKQAVLPVFFDRMLKEPQSELERVCRFIGYGGEPQWSHDLKPSNVSSDRVRRFPLYSALVESGPATWLRRRLVPQSWRDAVKDHLTMKKRPELGAQTKAELMAVFDQDLAHLGHWLGHPLDCDNFKAVTAVQSLDWVATDA